MLASTAAIPAVSLTVPIESPRSGTQTVEMAAKSRLHDRAQGVNGNCCGDCDDLRVVNGLPGSCGILQVREHSQDGRLHGSRANEVEQ